MLKQADIFKHILDLLKKYFTDESIRDEINLQMKLNSDEINPQIKIILQMKLINKCKHFADERRLEKHHTTTLQRQLTPSVYSTNLLKAFLCINIMF